MARAIDKDKLITSLAWYEQQGMISSIDDILDIIDDFPTLTSPNEWVSVEERLPPPKQNVLAYSPESGIAEADYRDGVWMQYRWSAVMRGVTHWMPLPAPPDKDNNVLAKTPNEPLMCKGCMYAPDCPSEIHCHGCARMYTDHYRRPPEGEEDTK